MKLSILINHYNEPFEILGRLLNSIKSQTESDYEIIICHDGLDGGLDANQLNQYQMNLTYVKYPHRGVCATRNTLIDMASGEYIMFCDADDMFYDSNGLKKLLEHNADVVASAYIQQHSDGHTSTLWNDIIRVHGKIFKRDYIINQNIRFPNEVISNGDMSFLWLALNLTKNIIWIPDKTYIWKYNPHSVTRRIPYYNIQTWDRVLKTYSILAEDLKARGRMDLYQSVIAINVTASYLNVEGKRWKNVPKEYRDHAIKAVKQFIYQYRDDYMNIDKQYRESKYLYMVSIRKEYDFKTKFNELEIWIYQI